MSKFKNEIKKAILQKRIYYTQIIDPINKILVKVEFF